MVDDRKNIIICALQLFKKYGVKSVSMDDISKELGISKKTLYKFFVNKNHIVENTIDYLFDQHFEKIDRILEKEISSLEKVILIYRYGISQILSQSPVFYYDLKKYHLAEHKNYDEYRKKIVFGIIQGLMEKAQQENKIRKDVDLQLFCEINFYKLDIILRDSDFNQRYTLRQILTHLIVFNLRGIIEDCSSIDI